MKINIKPLFLLASLGAIMLIPSCSKDSTSDPVTAANLYFADWDGTTVYKIDLLNAPDTAIALFDNTDGLTSPSSLTLTDNGYLIVTEENNNRIIKMKKDGTGEIVVLYDSGDGVSSPDAITIDNATGVIYWCNSGSSQVMKGSEDGSATPTALYDGAAVIDYAYGIAIDKKHGKLYISDFSLGIKVGNLDGTGTMDVLWDSNNYDAMSAPSNLIVDSKNGLVYWTDESSDDIVVAKLDGTGTPVVLFSSADGISRPDGIGIDYNSKKIYWSETSNNVIAMGNLDGTGGREVLVENVESYGLVLELK